MMSITCQYTLDMSLSDTVRDVSDVSPLPVRGTHLAIGDSPNKEGNSFKESTKKGQDSVKQ